MATHSGHQHGHGDHGHDHDHDHGDHSHVPAVTAENEKKILVSFLLIFGFMLVEAVGGIRPAHWRCWLMRGIC